jgi:hypothetical protein
MSPHLGVKIRYNNFTSFRYGVDKEEGCVTTEQSCPMSVTPRVGQSWVEDQDLRHTLNHFTVLKDVWHLEGAVCSLALNDLPIQRSQGRQFGNVSIRSEAWQRILNGAKTRVAGPIQLMAAGKLIVAAKNCSDGRNAARPLLRPRAPRQ